MRSPLLLILCLIAIASALPLSGSGQAAVDEHSIALKAAYAIWRPDTRELRLCWLTRPPTPELLKFFKAHPNHDYVLVEEPEPQPFVRIEMTLAAADGRYAEGKLKFWGVFLWRINNTGNLSLQGNHPRGTFKLQGDYRSGPIKVEASGSGWLTDNTRLSWNLKADCPVYPVASTSSSR